MAQIDVSELMSDPDFVDPIQVITRTPSVSEFGENTVNTVSTLSTIGSVQPASGRALQRLPEALRVANVSSFWFKGQIIATETSRYPSILVFRGKRYQVQTVMDWSNFGAGYTEGTCVAEAPS